MRLREWLGISDRRQRQVTWAMELLMAGVLLVGLWQRNVSVIVNAAGALAVAQLVPILERDYGVPLDAGLTLWITAAVFLHAFGTIGFPPGSASFYKTVPWWDDVTHALSSSVVAGLGYATVRAIDEHSDEVTLPPRFIFVFILLFVLAYGVLWEILEFAIGEVAASMGTVTILTQYGLHDSLTDLVFNTLGAVVVSLWGTAHLNDVAGYIEQRLDQRAA